MYSRMSMRCSSGRGLLVLDTSLDKQVAASSWEYDDCNNREEEKNNIKTCVWDFAIISNYD